MEGDYPRDGLGLGISATFRNVSLCLWKDGTVEAVEEWVSTGMHTQLLLWIKALLESRRYSFDDVKFLLVDTGPAESFTGLRLSLAIVKSWLMVKPHIRLYVTSSLSLFYDEARRAIPDYENRYVIAGFFGFQGRIYIQGFYQGQSLESVRDVPMDDLSLIISQYPMSPLLIGNFPDSCPSEYFQSPNFFPIISPHIHQALKAKEIFWRDLAPQYFRKTRAEEQFL